MYWRRISILTFSLGLALVPLIWAMPPTTSLFRSLNDSAHAALFFLISLCLLRALKPAPPQTTTSLYKYYATVMIICVSLGLAIESIQHFIGRSPSWSDVILDCWGIAAGTAFWLSVQLKPFWLRAMLLTASICTMAYCFREPAKWWYLEQVRHQSFPVIVDFEEPEILNFVKRSSGAKLTVERAPTAWKQNNSQVLKLKIPAHKTYPGFRFYETSSNWSEYKTLNFEVYSPGLTEQTLTLKLKTKRTAKHQPQFLKRYQLSPGLNQISLPLEDLKNSRAKYHVDPREITYFALYQTRPKVTSVFYIDNIHLN